MKKILLGGTLIGLLIVPTLVSAISKPSVTPSARVSIVATPSISPTSSGLGKLTEAKQKVCQNRENAIKQRDDQLTKMATNMLSVFDSIATRVQTYYTSKAVPAGKTVSNYDTLVADIAAKKLLVQTALTKAQTDASSFSCTGNDPKGQLALFKTDMQAVKTALKNYRTSIKNLIVAIRSVNGASPSASPRPSSSSSL